MSDLWARLRRFIDGRSLRERWLMVAGAGLILVMLLQALVITPLDESLAAVRGESTELQTDLLRSGRRATEIIRLSSELAAVEARIKPGENTNLLTLLERLADEAQIKDQLESIKPKSTSGNDRYPETRVEVSLRGATLKQAVSFLHRIETADVLLIIRSLRIKTRRDDSMLLDLSFSVSSFERA